MNSDQPSIVRAATQFWRDLAAREGGLAATGALLAGVWEFLRDSTPDRLRSRFGDAEYDWDHRVNTTSGAVGWRDRLLGQFLSPYQPTEPGLFHEMIDGLAEQTHLDFSKFTFIDLGSGKGRTLLMAAEYPFRRIVGVELLPSLHSIAQENIAHCKSESQRCFAVGSVCADAIEVPLPEGPLVIYLFNPFPEAGLRRFIANLEQALQMNPRPVYVLYHNPLLERLLSESAAWRKIGGTHQYSIFESAQVTR
jgi:SAM-dependent methyltransferase